MGSLSIVEPEVVVQADSRLSAVLVGSQIHFFVLYGPPQPLDEQIIVVAPLSIHADPDSSTLQECSEVLAGKLAALVGIEYLRFTLLECLLQRRDTKTSVQCVGEPPGQHVPAVPVDDGHQIEKSLCHGYVGDVRRPDLVRPGYLQSFKQVRVDLVPFPGFARPGTPVNGLEPHQAHQPPHPLSVDQVVLILLARSYLTCPVEWCGQVLSIDQLHQGKILLGDSF